MNSQADEQKHPTRFPVEAEAGLRFPRLTINRKFLTVFAALAVIGVSNWLVIDAALSSLRGAAALVNVIGSIRWMSQRAQLDAFRFARGQGRVGDVEALLSRLEDTIHALSVGGSVRGLDVRAAPGSLQSDIELLRQAFLTYRRAVRAVLDHVGSGREVGEAMETMYAHGDDVLTRADGLAAMLSRRVATVESNSAFNLRLLVSLDLMLLIAAMMVLRVHIMRPLQDLMRATQHFAKGDFDARTRIDADDEIGDLARTFDRMAEEIQQDMGRITSQMRELEKSEALLSKVLETLPVGVWVTDDTGRVVITNLAGQRIWAGRANTSLDLTAPPLGWWAENGQRIEAGEWPIERAVQRGQPSTGESIRIPCDDGSFKTLLSSAVPLLGTEGEIEGAIVVYEDITERQRAVADLAISKELFQTTFDLAAVGIALYDLSGCFLRVNGALCQTLGYEECELLRKRLSEISHADDLDKDEDLKRRLLEGGLGRYEVERRFHHHDGHVVWAVLSVALVCNGAKVPQYFIGQILDISPRKAREQELIESRSRLRELAAHDECVREEERKRIAMEIHDELGQLLTAIKMDISLLRMRYGTDPEVERRTGDMRELVEKTIGVVRQVAANLRPAALNLGIVPALEWLLEDFGQRSGIAYELNLTSGEVDLDDMRATAIFRIVQESLTNVMRHASASLVVVSLTHNGEALQLEVHDDSRGFDYHAVSRGPSFGLLGIRERAGMLKGALVVDSRPGRGTNLSIFIPYARRESA